MVLLAMVGLPGRQKDTAQAVTTVLAAHNAHVTLPGGVVSAARDGQLVPRGGTVETATGGEATLLTAGRRTLLGSATAVQVLDGATQQLDHGLVMVDARQAPGLHLGSDVGQVQIPAGAVLRLERGPLLRVADFAGNVVFTPTGRRAGTVVPALYQVQVASGALPGPVTPLALTGDRWERAVARDLVSEDVDLTALATGLDASGAAGGAVLSVLPALWRSQAPALPGAPCSEEALAFAVARAAAGGVPAQRYLQIRALRAAGGSWGVVAQLVSALVARVDVELEALLEPAGPPALADGRLSTSALAALLGTVPGASAGAAGSGRTGPGRAGSTGGAPAGNGAPGPAPTDAPGPVGTVVGTVLGLLPPLPVGSGAPGATATTPTGTSPTGTTTTVTNPTGTTTTPTVGVGGTPVPMAGAGGPVGSDPVPSLPVPAPPAGGAVPGPLPTAGPVVPGGSVPTGLPVPVFVPVPIPVLGTVPNGGAPTTGLPGLG